MEKGNETVEQQPIHRARNSPPPPTKTKKKVKKSFKNRKKSMGNDQNERLFVLFLCFRNIFEFVIIRMLSGCEAWGAMLILQASVESGNAKSGPKLQWALLKLLHVNTERATEHIIRHLMTA